MDYKAEQILERAIYKLDKLSKSFDELSRAIIMYVYMKERDEGMISDDEYEEMKEE